MEIGKSIKKNREFQGLSRKELADKLGINVSTLGRYETGKRNPDLTTLKKIADILYIDFDVLLSWTDILNSHPNVFDFLEKIYGFNYLEELALLLGTNQYDKSFLDFFNETFSDKTLYLKIANILELTEVQLYNWILILHIKQDYYKNKESYLRDYFHSEDIEDRLDYMITENKANLDYQSFDDLFYKGINTENRVKIKKYLKSVRSSLEKNSIIPIIKDELKYHIEDLKDYGDDWRSLVIKIESNPKFLLNSILKYLEENENFYSALSIDLYNNKPDNLPYFTDEQINSIVKKVTDLVEYEIYKIEKNFK